jgi:uncharacterized protein with PIN domain
VILYSSGIVAVLRSEPESALFTRAIAAAERCFTSAVSYVESAVVIETGGDAIASRRFDEFFRLSRVAIDGLRCDKQNSPARHTAISARGDTRQD